MLNIVMWMLKQKFLPFRGLFVANWISWDWYFLENTPTKIGKLIK